MNAGGFPPLIERTFAACEGNGKDFFQRLLLPVKKQPLFDEDSRTGFSVAGVW
jgi:hypothetical protein